MTDTERLDWLEKQDGYGLVSDDFGNWAISGDGAQNVPENPRQASDMEISFIILKKDWSSSIREAIDKAIKENAP